MDVNQVVGQLPDEYMRDIDIVRYDRSGNETRRCTLHTARVKVLEYDDLEGGNSQNSIEKLTICLQYWTGWQPHAICGLLDAEATALLVIGSAPRRGRIIVVARRCVSPATRRQ